jgi:hypothetical protein
VKLSAQTVTVILTEEGKQVLGLASVNLPESPTLIVTVEETDDLGLWIRITKEAQVHFLLLRWEFVLSIDIARETGKLVGLKGQ